MTTYGLTDTGFVPKTLEIILEEKKASLRGKYGSSVPLAADTLLGIWAGIEAEREAALWEGLEAVNSSQDPDAATGSALEALAALTGTLKLAATSSTVSGTLTGDNGTAITNGSVASTSSTSKRFELFEDVTLATATAWTALTPLPVEVYRRNAGHIYHTALGGTTGNTGGPVHTSGSVTEGSVSWLYVGEGAAYGTALFTASDTGEVEATSGDLTVIETPVSGWSSLYNLLDADLGRDVETDGELRARRIDELAIAGESTPRAIRADLLNQDNVPGVIAVTVFYNNTDTTNVDGVPPHSIEALVRGGEDQAIWDTLLISVGGGIGTYTGTGDTGTSIDGEGVSQTMSFSRPDEIEIYLILNLTYDSTVLDTADKRTAASDEIKLRIVTEGDKQATGKNAVAGWALTQAFATDGIIDGSMPLIDDAPAPATSTTVAISLRQLATYDTSRITINLTPGTP